MSHAHELAWCAGFFDGEGYISIVERNQHYKDKIYIGHYLRIGINHVSPQPLEEMKRVVGGTFVYDKNSEKPGKDGCKRKPRYKWLATTREAGNILVQLMPYLKNKNKAAELALDLQNTMQVSTKRIIPETLIKYRADLKTKLQLLNSLD